MFRPLLVAVFVLTALLAPLANASAQTSSLGVTASHYFPTQGFTTYSLDDACTLIGATQLWNLIKATVVVTDEDGYAHPPQYPTNYVSFYSIGTWHYAFGTKVYTRDTLSISVTNSDGRYATPTWTSPTNSLTLF